MSDVVLFAILGTATGALYALVALGVVLVYRASGVLNFASGATGAAGAAVFYDLRDSHGVWWIAALALGLVTGAAVGGLTYFLVMRLLEKSSRLAKFVATLGVMSMVQGALPLIFGGNGFSLVPGFLPTWPVKLTSSISIGMNQLILIGTVVVLAVVLRYIYKSTPFGLATSAVAENRRAAAALGKSAAKVEAINFVIAGTLSALAAILLAPLVGLDAATLTLLIIPALAAALVGRFSSFALTVAGAMGIGIIESEMVRYVQTPGWGQAVPFGVIIVVTVAGGRARPSRGDLSSRLPMPGSGRLSPLLLALAALAAAGGVFLLSASWVEAVTTTVLLAIVVLSIVVVTGFAGQLSLCQFALAGIGAWIAGRLASASGLPFWLAALIGVALTIPAGLIVALPALRTRGVNLAVVTLGLSIAVEGLIFGNPNLTGGVKGTVVSSPVLFGINLDPIGHPARYAVLAVAALTLLGILVTNVRRGRSGRRMLAVRSNERAAASLGVGVYGVKMYAFALGAGIAAVGGILITFANTNIVLSNFTTFNSVSAVQTSVIGGIGLPSGSVVAGLFGDGGLLGQIVTSLISALHGWFSWIPAVSVGTVQQYLPVVAGVSVVLVLRSAPDGIAAQIADRLRRWLPRPAPARDLLPSAGGRARAPKTTLRIDGLSVRFGGVAALDGVQLSLASGEILGVIGPNGAGKTTLLDAITGFVKPAGGSVMVNDQNIGGWTPERRARAGIVRSFQAVELFGELTVWENMLTAADRQSTSRYLTDLVRPGVQLPSAVMVQAASDFGLQDVLDKHPPELSHGTARLAGIARAMAAEPSVLLLDEPASGLDTRERQELKGLISTLARDRGVAVILVEHDVPLVLETCDRVLVLDFGRTIAAGLPDQVRTDPAVIAAYLGEPEGAAGDQPETTVSGLSSQGIKE
jgi:ABC-type branched-subunit amino acid transport system ATPase component/branched-subunit amino acid ABC-type transport system permease component